MIAGYLIRYHGLNSNKALALVRKKRQFSRPCPSFVLQLQNFETLNQAKMKKDKLQTQSQNYIKQEKKIRRAERKLILANQAYMAVSAIQAPDALSNPRIVN